MRNIGDLGDEHEAQIFGAYLYTQGIENTIRYTQEGSWAIWVYSEDQVSEAEQYFEKYLGDKSNPLYQEATSQAITLKKQKAREFKQSSNNIIDLREQWHSGGIKGLPRLTLALIVVSVAVTLLSGMGKNTQALQPFFITEFTYFYPDEDEYTLFQNKKLRMTSDGQKIYIAYNDLPEIYRGQVWRLFTPMFIHLGFLHIIFNMLWLKDLGGMIERRQGTLILLGQVLIISALSNLSQYAVSGPSFGGMSGVVYGLLGYIWIRGKYDPNSGVYLERQIVTLMILWFFLCLSGLIGNIANTAHGVGLVSGMTWGFLSAKWAISANR